MKTNKNSHLTRFKFIYVFIHSFMLLLLLSLE